MFKKRWILSFFLFCIVFYLRAQRYEIPRVWYFNELTPRQGLSELTNTALHTSSHGFAWISSQYGLNRFDGKDVQNYLPKTQNGGVEPSISGQIQEDSEGNIWFSTLTGFHCLEVRTDSITSYKLGNTAGDTVTSVYQVFYLDQKRDELWVLKDSIVYQYNTKTHEAIPKDTFPAFLLYAITTEDGKPKGYIKPLLEEEAGIELLLKDTNLASRQRFFTVDDPLGLPSATIFFVHIESDSTIWLPSSLGLIKFNPYEPDQYSIYQLDNGSVPSSMCAAISFGNDHLLVGTSQEGLLLFDKRKESFTRKIDKVWVNNKWLPLKRVNNLFLDEQATLWLAIWGERILFTSLYNAKFSSSAQVLPREEFLSRSVTSITKPHADELWFAVPDEGVYVCNKFSLNCCRKAVKFDPFSKQPYNKPKWLYADSDGDVWILSFSGIALWRRGKNKLEYAKASGTNFRRVVEIARDTFLLLSFEGIQKLVKTENQVTSINQLKLESVKSFLDFHYSDSGQLLVNGVNDLFTFNTNGDTCTLLNKTFNIGIVSDFAEEENAIWLTTNQGLYRYDKSNLSVEVILGPKRFLQRGFQGVLIDERRALWLSSNDGLYYFDRVNNKATKFTESDGIPNLQFNMGGQFPGDDGHFYFGNDNGFIHFDPMRVGLKQEPPKLFVKQLIINGTDTVSHWRQTPDFKNILELPFHQNSITIEYVALDFGSPLENSYAHHLRGYDQDTIFTANEGRVRYSHLPFGVYQLELMSLNSDEVWTNPGIQFQIRIRPPWYFLWYVVLIAILISGGITYSIYRFRVRQEIQKFEVARFRQELAENRMAVLRLQMNPHFIFNSLNAVGSFILEKEPINAYRYLHRFAKLIRKILDIAPEPEITIQEEVELLSTYLETEAVRLNHQFDWEVDIQEGIDVVNTMVPTMILQPFLENAIWHGIMGKEEKGKIRLSFEEDTEYLICTIEDDGVGRLASFQKVRKHEHESKAIKIIKERLRLLSKDSLLLPQLNILDLSTKDGNAAGTKVELKIPKAK